MVPLGYQGLHTTQDTHYTHISKDGNIVFSAAPQHNTRTKGYLFFEKLNSIMIWFLSRNCFLFKRIIDKLSDDLMVLLLRPLPIQLAS